LPSLKALVGMLLTTTLLILTVGVKVKDVDSFLTIANPVLSTMKDSARAQAEVAVALDVEVVHARMILDLMVASSSIPMLTMIARTLKLITTPDYLLSKPLVEVRAASVSVVLCLALLVLAPLLSASSTLAMDLS